MFKAVDIPAGAQLLILPVNRARVTAGYKNAAYLKDQGYAHYGIDYADPISGNKPIIYASGNGTVVAAGLDNVLGNTVVVRYPKVYIPATGMVQDLVLRYNHLDSIAVKAGQAVASNTPLGAMGMTGRYVSGVHLHLEVDTDTAHPLYSPTISQSSNIIKAGVRGAGDTTIDPSAVLVLKDAAPDNQTIAGDPRWPDWYSPADLALPKWSDIYAEAEIPATDDELDVGELWLEAQEEVEYLTSRLAIVIEERDAALARAEAAEAKVAAVRAALI